MTADPQAKGELPTDELVQRLLTPDYWIIGSHEGLETFNSAPIEAACCIKELTARVKEMEEALRSLLIATQPQHSLTHIFLEEAQEAARSALNPSPTEQAQGDDETCTTCNGSGYDPYNERVCSCCNLAGWKRRNARKNSILKERDCDQA